MARTHVDVAVVLNFDKGHMYDGFKEKPANLAT
jgi:hypothetical protein